MEISSRSNQTILDLKKAVKEKSLIVLDTPKLVEDARKKGVKFYAVLAIKQYAEMFDNSLIVTQSIIDLFSDVKTNAGIIAFIEREHKVLKPPQNNYLVLDTVQDPGNVGTLLRSALGADFNDIYLIDCASVSSKVIRSSMGSIFGLNVFETTKKEFISFAEKNNLNLVMADMDGENIYDINKMQNIGLVMGNEGNGVCDEIAKICKKTVKIPMNKQLESLNVAISGSIIMYQITYGGKR